MLVDSHCHLDAGEFDRDRDEVIARARAAGVARQVVPAIHAAGWPKLRDICAGANGLFPAYGLHPMFLAEHRPDQIGRASCRERVGQYGLILVVAVSLKKKKK